MSWKWPAVLAALLLAAASSQDKDADAAARRRLDEFKRAIRPCREPADFAKALDGLAREPHPLILAELKKWLAHQFPEVRIQAAREIGRFHRDEKAAQTLVGAAKAEKTLEVAVTCIDAVGDIALKGSARDLPPFFSHPSLDVCMAAVSSLADLKTRDSCRPILDFMAQLDAIREKPDIGDTLPGDPTGGPLPPGSQKEQDEKVKRKKELLPACVEAMKRLTGEKHGTLKEWQAWWSRNEKIFKGAGDRDEEVEASARHRLDEFKRAVRQCKAPADFAAALDGLARDPHPLILAELRKWLAHQLPQARIQAAKEIGRFARDEKAAEALVAAAKAEKAADVLAACVGAIGDVGLKSCAGDLPAFFKHPALDVCKAAVDSMADLKARDCCKPILELMAELDGIPEKPDFGDSLPGVPGSGPLPPGGDTEQDARLKRKKELTAACVEAMKRLTGEKFETVKEWQTWWSKAEKSFRGANDPQEPKPEEKR